MALARQRRATDHSIRALFLFQTNYFISPVCDLFGKMGGDFLKKDDN
jgi:hypothetical protein